MRTTTVLATGMLAVLTACSGAHADVTTSVTSAPMDLVPVERTATSTPTPIVTTPPTPTPTTPAPAPTRAVSINHGPKTGRTIYLTFDDGPDPRWTPSVLRLLSQHHAHATFFMIGSSAADHPELVRAVREQGSVVANHSWSHPNLTHLGASDIAHQITRTDAVIGGSRCVRPPMGATNHEVRTTLDALGKTQVLWSIDTRDWQRPGTDMIVKTAVGGAIPTSIVLMHDGGGDRSQSVKALSTMLKRWSARGYTIKALPQCR